MEDLSFSILLSAIVFSVALCLSVRRAAQAFEQWIEAKHGFLPRNVVVPSGNSDSEDTLG